MLKYSFTGDHTHIFWDCPKLSGYWHDIQNEIKKCLKIEVPLEPSYFLVGILPENLENNSQTSLLRILLVENPFGVYIRMYVFVTFVLFCFVLFFKICLFI